MTHDTRHGLRLAAVTAAGLATLVGSGGGFPPFELDPDGIGGWPASEMQPARQTVQVGTPARFVVATTHVTQPTFRWCRVPRGGSTCELIAGATGDTYTLASATLADDGALVQVTVTDPKGTTSAQGSLFVSSMPPVIYRDGDFGPETWTATTWADPASGGPSAEVSTQASGGNPGAFRQTTILVPVVPSALRIYQTSQTALYDPAAQGAIHVIDATEDCETPGASTSNAYIGTVPLLLQGGRRYVATDNWSRGCSGSSTWIAASPRAAMASSDFRLIDGPACTTGESCPNFGVDGAPIRLGFAQLIETSAAGVTGTRTRGIDNWTMTIWRR